MRNKSVKLASDDNEALLDFCASSFTSPLRYVLGAFPWKDGEGPDTWQIEVLNSIEDRLNALDGLRGKPAMTERTKTSSELRGRNNSSATKSLKLAVVSGHGVGKTALVAWLILWAMSTRPHLAGVVTANTAAQLKDKTWRELALWHKKAINAQWFTLGATKIYQNDNPDTWFVSAVPWRREQPEAFAGLHAEHVLMIFDEASAIDPAIYETAEGAMTTKGAMWFAFGNPTRASGKFYEVHNRMRHRWRCIQVDSRTAKMANALQIKEWVEDYGEDSDFVRVRVKGEFPRAGTNQLISNELVFNAVERELPPDAYSHAPVVLGVDVARFGDDQSVIVRRQGLKLLGIQKFRGLDTMTMAALVADEIEKYAPDCVFVDQGGVGGGVVDRLRQLGCGVTGIDFGGAAIDKHKYVNRRAEMWCAMKEWLKSASIPGDKELEADLTAPEYGFRGDNGQIQLEKKEDMKKRGLASPDSADALALTFALPVHKKEGETGHEAVLHPEIYYGGLSW